MASAAMQHDYFLKALKACAPNYLQLLFASWEDFQKYKLYVSDCSLTHKQGRAAPTLSNPNCFGNQITQNKNETFVLKQSAQKFMS